MKKVFALVLALILALSLFACGKKSEDTGTADGAETKPVSETAAENTGADAPKAEETPAATDTAEDPAQAVTPTENTTPSGSSSASNSGNTGSSSNSSSSSMPVHEHSWQAVYREVQVADYETKYFALCVTCGEKLTDQQQLEHSSYHLERGESDQQRDISERTLIGYHTEQELAGFRCSCGATKNP